MAKITQNTVTELLWIFPLLNIPHIKGEGHSRKRIYNVYIELTYSPKFQLLKCILYQEISLQRSPERQPPFWNKCSAAERDVMSPNLNLTGSGILFQAILFFSLSGFLCSFVWKCRRVLPPVVQTDRVKIQKNI